MLDALGLEIRKYHMNEGHSSLLALELLQKNGLDIEKVRRLCVFTTHTPVDAGHDKFSYNLVREVLGDPVPLDVLKKLGGQERLNMILFALNLSNYHNGVAKRHRDSSRAMFPGYEIRPSQMESIRTLGPARASGPFMTNIFQDGQMNLICL